MNCNIFYLDQQNKNVSQFKILIEDKDSLIKELRDEGEKLSKQHLTLNNIIKKLRVTEKESSKTINKYKLVPIILLTLNIYIFQTFFIFLYS